MAAARTQDAHRDDDRDDDLDDLTDDDLESEIELVSELVVAATSSDGPLGQDEVDHLLGVVMNDDVRKDGPAAESET